MDRFAVLFAAGGMVALLAATEAAYGDARAPADPHRPVFHVTPLSGHLNDANGMFYDPENGRFHWFHQYDSVVAGAVAVELDAAAALPERYWYHLVSDDGAHFQRLGFANVTGCSGGAAVRPDGTPLLLICGGATATPANRSDPDLREWVQHGVDATDKAYFPPTIPGKWDGSIAQHTTAAGGTGYRATFGSCHMLPLGRERPHQANGYCDGAKQDGTPQVLQYESADLSPSSWRYVGVPWNGTHGDWGPRIECPYEVFGLGGAGDNRSVLVLSAPGASQTRFVVGQHPGAGSNGSTFVPAGPPVPVDSGSSFYAGAVMALPGVSVARSWLVGWLREQCDITRAVPPRVWDSALSLPRELSLVGDEVLQAVPAELAALRASAVPTLTSNVSVAVGEMVPLSLGGGVVGDAIEVRLNWTASAAAPGLRLVVRATAGAAESTNATFAPAQGLSLATHSVAAGTADVASTSASLVDGAGRYTMRVFVDHSVVEAFVNDRRVGAVRAYPSDPSAAVNAWLTVDGEGSMLVDSVEVWGMTSMWIQ